MEERDPDLPKARNLLLGGDPRAPASPRKRKKEEEGEEGAEREALEKKLRRKRLEDWNKMEQKWKAGKEVSPELLDRGVTGGLETGKPVSGPLLTKWIGDDPDRKRRATAELFGSGQLEEEEDMI